MIVNRSTGYSWDLVYSSELANFEDIGDEGEVWSVDFIYTSHSG